MPASATDRAEEAADTIEAQAAEIERLRGAVNAEREMASDLAETLGVLVAQTGSRNAKRLLREYAIHCACRPRAALGKKEGSDG